MGRDRNYEGTLLLNGAWLNAMRRCYAGIAIG
jgi:hypothetical protein